MTVKKVIYFDKIPSEFKAIIQKYIPYGIEILYWEEMNKKERERELPISTYLLVVSKKIDKEILLKAKNACLIQRTGVGVNNIDIETSNLLQIPVAILPGGNSIAVAEHTILLILALYRKLPLVNQETKEGKWPNWEYRTSSFEMNEKTHGFIGFGNIGQETAKRSKVFNTRIIYYDPYISKEQIQPELEATSLLLDEVLELSDILSIHIPLSEETHLLINKEKLKLMKRNALLINISRGGIVNEKDLYNALKEEFIAGAAIDTWEMEPTHLDNPLLSLNNVLATPHIAAGTLDTFERVVKKAFQNIKLVESGRPPQFIVNQIKD